MSTSNSFDIAKLKSGDRQEYRKVYFEFYDMLLSIGKQYLMDTYAAEEIVQNAFMKLWEIRGELNDKSNIRNFLFTLAKNNCLNHLRNKQNANRLIRDYYLKEIQYNYEALEKIGDSYLDFQELKDKIDQAISALPDELRIVFEMHRFYDKRYKDIAEELKISQKTVEARMSKALKILRNELKDYLPLLYMITNLFS